MPPPHAPLGPTVAASPPFERSRATARRERPFRHRISGVRPDVRGCAGAGAAPRASRATKPRVLRHRPRQPEGPLQARRSAFGACVGQRGGDRGLPLRASRPTSCRAPTDRCRARRVGQYGRTVRPSARRSRRRGAPGRGRGEEIALGGSKRPSRGMVATAAAPGWRRRGPSRCRAPAPRASPASPAGVRRYGPASTSKTMSRGASMRTCWGPSGRARRPIPRSSVSAPRTASAYRPPAHAP